MVPGDSIAGWPLPASGYVVREVLAHRRPRRFRGTHDRPGALLGC